MNTDRYVKGNVTIVCDYDDGGKLISAARFVDGKASQCTNDVEVVDKWMEVS